MIKIEININSPAYKRLVSAGFYIFNLEMSVEDSGVYYLRCFMSCVCGRVEAVETYIENFLDYVTYSKFFTKDSFGIYLWNVAQSIEDAGAVSVEHLKEDGYSDEQIKEIRKAYN